MGVDPEQLAKGCDQSPTLACGRSWSELPDFNEYANACQNCGKTCERLTFIPEFEYMGCDDCVAEALAVVADKQSTQIRPWEACPARLALANECSTVSEFRQALRTHAAGCAVCGDRKTIQSDHSPDAVVCTKEVA